MRAQTIERLSQRPEALELWVLHWIIRHYGLTPAQIAQHMGYTSQYVGQILLGQYPNRLDDLDTAIYELTKDVVCCQAKGELSAYLSET